MRIIKETNVFLIKRSEKQNNNIEKYRLKKKRNVLAIKSLLFF